MLAVYFLVASPYFQVYQQFSTIFYNFLQFSKMANDNNTIAW